MSGAIFLSYASQDAAAARRICDALRAAGLEVWFDQNELVGGDAWDRKIRTQIRDCALFLPLISANTQARLEGYFRLEWKLAEDRSHLMAKGRPFLVPVVIDATSERDAHVPDAFLAVQWTRLAAGDPSPAFVAHIQRLLNSPTVGGALRPDDSTLPTESEHKAPPSKAHPRRPSAAKWSLAAVAALAIAGYFHFQRATPTPAASSTAPVAAPTPPVPTTSDKSLVVLPLENLSPDPENAFFADGMHAEIISTLSRIPDLKVISRESSLALKGSSAPLAEKAARVAVANVLSGSIRRDAKNVRIHLELRRARDEAMLWQQTYDKPLEDGLLTIQSHIAEQVARILQARDPKGTFASARFLTANREAHERLMKLRRAYDADGEVAASAETIAELEAILRLDPTFMPAADLLSSAHSRAFDRTGIHEDRARHAAEARRWAEIASQLIPGGSGDGALAHYYYRIERDLPRSLVYANNLIRALPHEATGHNWAALALSGLGRSAESLAAYERALELDPISPIFLRNYLAALSTRRRVPEAERVIDRILALGDNPVARRAIEDARFRLRGEIAPAAEPTLENLWRNRRFAEAERLAVSDLDRNRSPSARLFRLYRLAIIRQRLGNAVGATTAAQEVMQLAQELQSLPEFGPSAKPLNLARAYAVLGNDNAAVTHARRAVDLAANESDVRIRWSRELSLAEIHAHLGQARECAAVLAPLLRLPSGITVPMLKVDPTWDPVRDDPAFQALLADPKNSAPL